MKPRNTVAQTQSTTRLPLELIEHDGRHFLECNGSQIAAQHLGYPARELMRMICPPFRPAKQPRLIFLGLGFGQAIDEAKSLLPQEKASFVVLPEANALPDWLSKHLEKDPLDDEHGRVFIDPVGPFQPISKDYAHCQAIMMDLDHLQALSPVRYDPTHPASLHNIYETLKNGGLLGMIGTRLDNSLKKKLQKCGFEVVHEFVPLSEKSKKNRTLYLARKGHYRSNR